VCTLADFLQETQSHKGRRGHKSTAPRLRLLLQTTTPASQYSRGDSRRRCGGNCGVTGG